MPRAAEGAGDTGDAAAEGRAKARRKGVLTD